MIDLLFGVLATLGAGALVWHLLPKSASGAAIIPTTLEGFGQILSHGEQAVIGRLEALEKSLNLEALTQRIETIMSQAAQDIAAKIAALPAEFEAASAAKLATLQTALDAEKADHAADLTTVDQAVTAATPAPAAPVDPAA